jgi:hypothetical protein
MVLLGTSEEWQQQTTLLLKARPTTVRECAHVTLFAPALIEPLDTYYDEIQHPQP